MQRAGKRALDSGVTVKGIFQSRHLRPLRTE
ncbi:hypothetical protein ACT4US_23970 [Bacillus sp. HC-Mk]